MTNRRARITALGRYVPPKVVTNDDLARIVDTNDAWIRTRTGIVKRHYAEPGVPTSELAYHATQDLLGRRKIKADEIDLIIVATVTPDMMFPATACILQEKIGAAKAWGFDIEAACSGFTYALTLGAQFIESGAHEKVLVVGADVMTSIIDFTDRATCILFGDGAGAVLLEPSDDENGILGFHHEVDGTGRRFLYMLGGGSLNPATPKTVADGMHYIRQEGQHVFKYAVRKMADASVRVLEKYGVRADDVDLFVAHQANVRIIDAAQQRLGLPDSKVVKNIDRYGNTTAATIPLALGTALDEGRLKKGDTVVMTSVGAGFTVGAVLLRWSAVPWS